MRQRLIDVGIKKIAIPKHECGLDGLIFNDTEIDIWSIYLTQDTSIGKKGISSKLAPCHTLELRKIVFWYNSLKERVV